MLDHLLWNFYMCIYVYDNGESLVIKSTVGVNAILEPFEERDRAA